MFVAHKLKDKNICEYLLYMWQVEDTIRAFDFDVERLQEGYLSRFEYDEPRMKQLVEWYDNLITMMREEGVMEKGHLQMNKGTMILLNDMHLEALDDPKAPFYSAAYYKALPYIVELRAKGGGEKPEVETCLDALYGVVMLRLQKKDVSKDTLVAVDAITHLLALLSKRWNDERINRG